MRLYHNREWYNRGHWWNNHEWYNREWYNREWYNREWPDWNAARSSGPDQVSELLVHLNKVILNHLVNLHKLLLQDPAPSQITPGSYICPSSMPSTTSCTMSGQPLLALWASTAVPWRWSAPTCFLLSLDPSSCSPISSQHGFGMYLGLNVLCTIFLKPF